MTPSGSARSRGLPRFRRSVWNIRRKGLTLPAFRSVARTGCLSGSGRSSRRTPGRYVEHPGRLTASRRGPKALPRTGTPCGVRTASGLVAGAAHLPTVPVPEGTPLDRHGGRHSVSGPARANGSDLPVRSAGCHHPEGRRPSTVPDPYARNATGFGHLPTALNAYRLAANVLWRLPSPGSCFGWRGRPRRASRSLIETRSGDEGLHSQRSAPSLAEYPWRPKAPSGPRKPLRKAISTAAANRRHTCACWLLCSARNGRPGNSKSPPTASFLCIKKNDCHKPSTPFPQSSGAPGQPVQMPSARRPARLTGPYRNARSRGRRYR